MECNRDEAIRAKEIAETKLEKKDFSGAKKFALKSKTLYPGIEGISQMLAIIDVHVAAENKIGGEVDWYGVLGVNPSSDDETIKKYYRKLALLLHPDKNKFFGADGAFKLISEAWSLLSDKTKRSAYNQRRVSKGLQQKVSMHAEPSKPNGYQQHFGSRASVPVGQKSSAAGMKATSIPTTQSHIRTDGVKRTSSIPTKSQIRSDTFWTICHRCKMHYEYLKMYLNQTLLCPNCSNAFQAFQTAPPFNSSKSSNPAPRPNSSNNIPSPNPFGPSGSSAAAQKAGPGQAAGSSSFRHANHQQNPPPSGIGSGVRMDPSIAERAANVVQQAQEKMKRAYAESHAAAPAGWEGEIKRRKTNDDGYPHGMNYNMPPRNGSFGSATGTGLGTYSVPGSYSVPNRSRELTPFETRNMLMDKARKELLTKLWEWRSDSVTNGTDKEKEVVECRMGEKHLMNDNNMHGNNLHRNGEVPAMKVREIPNAKCPPATTDKEDDTSPAAAMTVPDPDFHDFDQDRNESSFGDNEVWAAYDDDDGMPRFYALISKVISRDPFKLRISWLNSKTNTEFGSLDWVGSGFYKTCGEFRVGRYETCTFINSFSQKINWLKGPRGTILIFPKKDDVWALYKNWSSDWNEQTSDEVIHEYEMVKVLDDYNEEHGVSVAPLVKVFGFKTVFRPNLDPEMVKIICREEMFRFSHRVPSHVLTGQEAENAPEDCLELDPAATPLDLLQVIRGADEVPMMRKAGDAKEDEQAQVLSDTTR